MKEDTLLCGIFNLHAYSWCKETSHVVKQKSAYAPGWSHHDYIVNVYAKREQYREKVCVSEQET